MIASIRYIRSYPSTVTGQLEPAEVFIEIARGDDSQVWRAKVEPGGGVADIRDALGKALQELGRSIRASHGFPLIDPRKMKKEKG